MRVKHYIITRFFSEMGLIGDKIFDEDFLKDRFENIFIPNIVSSLNNIPDDFELIILIHDDIHRNSVNFFNSLKSLFCHPYRIVRLSKLSDFILKTAVKENIDFVCESRLDYDDFMFSDVIKDIHSHINPELPVKMYGYEKGYTYNTYLNTLYKFDWTFRRKEIIGLWSTCATIILRKDFLLKHPELNAYTVGDHGKTKVLLKEKLNEWGEEFQQDMWEYNDKIDAFIYFRHPAAYSVDLAMSKNPDFTPDIMPEYMRITLDSSVDSDYLSNNFGFHYKIEKQNFDYGQ